MKESPQISTGGTSVTKGASRSVADAKSAATGDRSAHLAGGAERGARASPDEIRMQGEASAPERHAHRWGTAEHGIQWYAIGAEMWFEIVDPVVAKNVHRADLAPLHGYEHRRSREEWTKIGVNPGGKSNASGASKHAR